MGAPETSDTNQVVGNWVIVQPGLPDALAGILETIQSLVTALLAILNIALAILNIIKAFLIGFLNPLLAIIEAIINEIEAILRDIRQIGIYISGDLKIEGDQFETILGGFAAYERRMIGRLVNRRDPSRPAFSSRSAVIAIFLYASVDVTGIATLIKIIQKVMAFFGQTVPAKSFTVAVGLQATYGLEGATLASYGPLTEALKAGAVPNTVNLRWRMAPPPTGQTVLFPRMAPKGFLIEVSTLRDGLLLGYDTYVKNATVGEDNKPSRVYGLMRDPLTGTTFRLYGGPDMIDPKDMSSASGWEEDKDGSSRKTRLYAYRDSSDNVPIPLTAMMDGTKHLLQRAFFVKAGLFNIMGPGQGFATTLSLEDMPYDAEFENKNGTIVGTAVGEPASTVYVRVSAVTKSIADKLNNKTAPVSELNFYTIDSSDLSSQVQGLGNAVLRVSDPDLTPSDKAPTSFPLTVTFPSASTQAYLDTVTAALAVLVLARADLAVNGEVAEAQAAALAAAQTADALGLAEASIEVLEAAFDAKDAAEAALAASIAANPFTPGTAQVETGLEDISQWLVPLLVGNNMSRYFDLDNVSPETFRSDLLRRCQVLANYLYSQTGPLGDIEGLVVDAGAALLEFKWSSVRSVFPDETIIESLGSTANNTGLGLNPMSMGMESVAAKKTLAKSSLPRLPAFAQKTTATPTLFLMGMGSADYSPVVYNHGSSASPVTGVQSVQFCRNALPGEIFGAAAIALNIAAAPLTLSTDPKDSTWKIIRLFPQGLPALEQALEEIIGWVRAILSGISGIIDVIINYINFIEARILELQALINRINALLQSLLDFVMPQMAGLVVTANGTDGILSALVTADNKPSDGTAAYGAGVVLLAGGLPSIAIELLQAFFPESDLLNPGG